MNGRHGRSRGLDKAVARRGLDRIHQRRVLDPADAASQRRPVGELNRLDPSYAVPAVLTGGFNARSNENRPVYREHLAACRRTAVAQQ